MRLKGKYVKFHTNLLLEEIRWDQNKVVPTMNNMALKTF